jgi:uncharacterized protein (TIGR03382 family)
VTFGSSTFSGGYGAVGGTSARGKAADGTVKVVNTASNALRLQGGTYIADGTTSFTSVTLLAGAHLVLAGPAEITGGVTVSSGAKVTLASVDALTKTTLASTISGTLQVDAPFTLGALTVPGQLIINAATTTGDLSASGTLFINKKLTPANLTLVNGGVMTHDAQVADMVVESAGTVLVQTGALVDLTAKGLASALTIDPNTLLVVPGAGQYVGASHGGLGNKAAGSTAVPAVYDSQTQPQLLGSGGGYGCCGWRGGAGGGRIRLVASTVQVDGNIVARGEGGLANTSAGGSGGAVWISATTFKGSGVISATGGASSGSAGAGGGGRVAVDYATSTFTGAAEALGGSGANPASAGTVYLRSTGTAGNLVVQAGDYHLTSADSYNSVTLLAGATLHLDGAPRVTEPIAIPSGTSVWVNDTNAGQNVTLKEQVDGTLVINAPFAWTGAHLVTGTLTIRAPTTTGQLELKTGSLTTLDDRLDVDGDLLMSVSSALTHSLGVRKMNVRVTKRMLVASGAVVDANEKGLSGGARGAFGCNGTALNPDTKLLASGATQFGGGSFGGLGGGTSNAVYGSATDMEYPGSGGACGANGGVDFGGHGGGLIRVSAQVLDLFGTIRANGGAPTTSSTNQGGGGSGGGVLLRVTNLTGSGVIQANGGSAPSRGGGGGGRIRLEVVNNTFTGFTESQGGTGTTAQGGAASAPVVVPVTAPATIISTPIAFAKVGTPWLYDADGVPEAVGSQPITWSLESGPPTATINTSNGAISWTPTSVGVASFTLRATNPQGFVDQTFTVQAMVPPAVTSTASTVGHVATPYFYNSARMITATGSSPLTFVATLAPPGSPTLSVDALGNVTWTPSAAGTFNACVRVSNAVGFVDHCWSVTVTADAAPPLISSTPPTVAQVNKPYIYQVIASGTPPVTFAMVSGSTPQGMSIEAATGLVTWTPSTAGKSFACIQATGVGTDTQCWEITVQPPASLLQIVSTCNPLATAGQAYHYDEDDTVSAVGTMPITWELSDGPSGMTLDANGKIAWTPTAPGAASYSVKASNAAGSAIQSCVVTVRPVGQAGPPIILRVANPIAAIGPSYRYDPNGRLEADGDQPITYSKVSGPAELFVDPKNGFVAWTPTVSGPQEITVKAQNPAGEDSYTFTVDVASAPGAAPVATISGGPFVGDAPLSLSLDAKLSTAGGAILSRLWDFGDGSPPVEGETASHVYKACGGYVARLTITDTFGQSRTDDRQVLVSCNGQKPPSAKIVLSSVVGDGSLAATFSCDCSVGTGTVSGHQWLSTDGFFSDLSEDAHTFGPGGHTLQLMVVDSNGLSAIDRVFVRVADASQNKPPFVSVHASPPGGTPPLSIRYSADYGDPDGYVTASEWTFADTGKTQELSPVKSYEKAGLERAVFTVTDNRGLSSSAFAKITIGNSEGEIPPEFISTPRTSVFAAEAYSYDKDGLPAVRGTSPFVFSLLTAPEGATVDTSTGQISWTPRVDQIGPFGFSLQVQGKAGSAAQDWTVEVAAIDAPPKKGGCSCDGAPSAWALGAALLASVLFRRRPRSARKTAGGMA